MMQICVSSKLYTLASCNNIFKTLLQLPKTIFTKFNIFFVNAKVTQDLGKSFICILTQTKMKSFVFNYICLKSVEMLNVLHIKFTFMQLKSKVHISKCF